MNTLMLFAVDIIKIGFVIYVAKFGLMLMKKLFRQLARKLDETDILGMIFPEKRGRHEHSPVVDDNGGEYINDRREV